MKLLSIQEEAKACRKAFKDSKSNDLVWLCHHTILFERLNEPAENRINYILSRKVKKEQALRLRLFRPAPELKPIWKEYERIEKPAQKEYIRIEKPAWEEYYRIKKSAYAEYIRIEKPDQEEYERILNSAWEEYERIQKSSWEEYERIQKPAWKNLNTKANKLYKQLFPESPWNGKNIFSRIVKN